MNVSICVCTVEMPAVGGVQPKADFRVVDPMQYVTGRDYFVLVLELFLVTLVLTYAIEEVTEIIEEGREYWTSLWNFIDIINIMVFIAVIFIRIFSDIVIVSLLKELKAGASFVDFQPLAYTMNQGRNLNAFNAVLCWLKMFKYLSISPKMSMFTKVLGNASSDILVFLAMFGIVYFGFAQGFYVAFHTSITEFRSMTQSIFSLFR